MAICKIPYCVSEAMHGGYCVVHTRPIGAVNCKECHGTATVGWSSPIKRACQSCGGTGYTIKKPAEKKPKPAAVDSRDLMRVMDSE